LLDPLGEAGFLTDDLGVQISILLGSLPVVFVDLLLLLLEKSLQFILVVPDLLPVIRDKYLVSLERF